MRKVSGTNNRVKRKRFARLLHLYAFPKLTENYDGIWLTRKVEKFDTPEPDWTIELTVTWAKCRPLGTIERVPEWFINEYGNHVDTAALRGEPNPNPMKGE